MNTIMRELGKKIQEDKDTILYNLIKDSFNEVKTATVADEVSCRSKCSNNGYCNALISDIVSAKTETEKEILTHKLASACFTLNKDDFNEHAEKKNSFDFVKIINAESAEEALDIAMNLDIPDALKQSIQDKYDELFGEKKPKSTAKPKPPRPAQKRPVATGKPKHVGKREGLDAAIDRALERASKELSDSIDEIVERKEELDNGFETVSMKLQKSQTRGSVKSPFIKEIVTRVLAIDGVEYKDGDEIKMTFLLPAVIQSDLACEINGTLYKEMVGTIDELFDVNMAFSVSEGPLEDHMFSVEYENILKIKLV